LTIASHLSRLPTLLRVYRQVSNKNENFKEKIFWQNIAVAALGFLGNTLKYMCLIFAKLCKFAILKNIFY